MGSQNAYNSLLEVVKNRRSVRQFKPDPIPDEFIDKIIEVALWAPSGANTQPWEFIVVKKKEFKEIIIDAIGNPNLVGYKNVPVFIILLGDWRAKVGLPDIVQQQDSLIENVFCSSLASAFLYMHLAATTLGLASCWVSATSRPEPQQKIKELLHIPEELFIYDMMVVGYGAHSQIPQKVIRNLAEVVHYDDSGGFRTNEEVIAYMENKRKLGAPQPIKLFKYEWDSQFLKDNINMIQLFCL